MPQSPFRNTSRRSFLRNASLAAMAFRGRGALALLGQPLPGQTTSGAPAPPRAATSGPAAASPTPSSPVVRTKTGVLRGESATGVRIFRGIPFAEPPVGDLRFRPTVKVKPWSGERDATKFGSSPPQFGETHIPHSEDCLQLNIWAPEGKGPFPVFFWIHGGGFTGGHAFDGIYDGSEFAREGIVCITVAYRLGVFGFLNFGPLLGAQYDGTANNALHDLITALEWVHENVEAFGGDPSRVTIGGESAGAKLSDILMGVPAAHPFFHQIISESGGAERVWSKENSAAVANGYADVWRKLSGSDVASLRTAPAQPLIQAQHAFITEWPQHFPLRCEIDGTLLPGLPVDTIAGGSSRGKRLLIGTNLDESALFVGPHPTGDATAADIGNITLQRFSPIYQKYKGVYPNLTAEQLRIRALSAEEYWVPSMRVVDAHIKGGGTAWMYRLDFVETSGRLQGYAYHSLDIGLVWDHPHGQIENAAAESVLARQMHLAWTSFIRGEAPAAPGLPTWPQYGSDTRSTMVLEDKSHVEQKPQESELRLWDGVL